MAGEKSKGTKLYAGTLLTETVCSLVQTMNKDPNAGNIKIRSKYYNVADHDKKLFQDSFQKPAAP